VSFAVPVDRERVGHENEENSHCVRLLLYLLGHAEIYPGHGVAPPRNHCLP
jgi:hypothetical protein